ncbi:GMC oxidoreductase [Lophiostoma macrostomum CBS 122681]|uniref:GMC oxidoreductase n=1 Tax=Lophiostoma macrostomum CBS 122681 TaxID=1314788 RepID=A0A6A6T4B7_9PLEO|nr:GMC oxidoreductase [Lophiostoma macrostomum CBS 122681]
MTTVTELPRNNASYDYIIVGGGTAGCVVASRLAQYLPDKTILVIEGGPSDHKDLRILDLKKIVELWGGDFDYNYTSIEQPFGNSHIVHSRAKVLGGCSSHNGGISFLPFEYDTKRWEKLGAEGWSFAQFTRLIGKLRVTINPVLSQYQNAVDKAFIKSCAKTFDIPEVPNFNQEILKHGYPKSSTGFIDITYDPSNGYRSSASNAYIHPILTGQEHRPNLTILTNAWVDRVNVKNNRAVGVNVRLQSGKRIEVLSRRETILCTGSIDTPRLLLLSGIGPAEDLKSVGVPLVQDLPGVGNNLMDHPETIVMWEMNEELPPEVINHSEAAMFLRREPYNANGDDGDIPDTLFHMFSIPFDSNIARMNYEAPKNAYCMIPNVSRPRSRGRLYLTSADPTVKPAIDFGYLSDPEKYDQKALVYMVKQSRKMAEQAPFKDFIKREVAPGPHIQSDADLIEYNRQAHNTVYHSCGTAKMGNTKTDPLAVVDPTLKVKGIAGLRIADASIFPVITSANPMLTVLAIGERAAELIVGDVQNAPLALHKL